MTRKRPTQNGITPPAVFNMSGSTGLSRDIWPDATTPKTDKPVRFVPGGFDVGSFIGSSIVRGPSTFSR